MRFLSTISWQDPSKPTAVSNEEAQAFTLHSLKVCLLAAGAQVRAAELARQHQGHHKSQSTQCTIVSRDDTILALVLQRQICHACADGWRPARPIARGGQPPTLEPPFSKPKFSVGRTPPPTTFPRAASLFRTRSLSLSLWEGGGTREVGRTGSRPPLVQNPERHPLRVTTKPT